MELKLHPITALFPHMSADEFADLKRDIERHGILRPVLVWKGQVIDGRSRYLAAMELRKQGVSVEIPTEAWSGKGSLTELVMALNIHRRHLSTAQKVACAVEAQDWLERERRAAQGNRRRSQAARANQAAKSARQQAEAGDDDEDTDDDDEGEDTEVIKGGPQSTEPAGSDGADTPSDPGPDPLAGVKTRDLAATAFGVSGRSVQRGSAVRAADPALFEKMRRGEVTVTQAERAMRRQERRDVLEQIASELEGGEADVEAPWEILVGDVLQAARDLPAGEARLVFADPPYNQGIDYGAGPNADLLPHREYEQFCMAWMEEAWRLLTPDGSFWVLISEDYADHYGLWLRAAGFTRRRWIVWDESFGQNMTDNFAKDCRHLFYCVKDRTKFIFNRDAFLTPSARQAKYHDRRAAVEGRIGSNVWRVPRLNDVSPERVPGVPTQLPEALLRPIVAGVTMPGDLVIDLFAGSGSLGAATLKVRPGPRRFRGFELHAPTARLASARLAKVQRDAGMGEPLDAEGE